MLLILFIYILRCSLAQKKVVSKYTVYLNMAWKFWLHIQNVRTTGILQYVQYYVVMGTGPRALCVLSIYSTS